MEGLIFGGAYLRDGKAGERGVGWCAGHSEIMNTWYKERSYPLQVTSQPTSLQHLEKFPQSLARNVSFFYFIDSFGQKDTIEPP